MSFFRAELYCSSERKGSPLGNVSSGDLVAISQTPSYHSSGHRPEGATDANCDAEVVLSALTNLLLSVLYIICSEDTEKQYINVCLNQPEPSTANPMTTE